jgi:integrase
MGAKADPVVLAQRLVLRRAPDGRLCMRIYLGRSRVTGRAVRPQLSFPAGTPMEEAVPAARRWAVRQYAAWGLGASSNVGELMDVWLDLMRKQGAKRSTLDAYGVCCGHAAPLRAMDIGDVRPVDVRALLADMTGRGYARKTVQLERSVLGRFWREMRELGVTDGDPVSGARLPPGAGAGVPKALDRAQAMALEGALAEDAFHDVGSVRGAQLRELAFGSWLALKTGLRVGEVCALRRADYDELPGPTLRVRGTVDKHGERHPTTKGGRPRSVALSEPVAGRVREHMAWSGDEYGGGPSSPLVTLGRGFVRPTTLSRWLKRRARELGLPPWVHFHTLRHTHATLLVASGVDPKTVSERLGHADVATTLRYYGHVMPGRDAEAASRFDEIMGDGGVR